MNALSVHVLTLFPGMFESFLSYGMVKRAIDRQALSVDLVDIRHFAEDRHRTVDDVPYGGGAGMIMKPDVLARSLQSVLGRSCKPAPKVILLTPQGKRFDQDSANRLSMDEEIILVCGRYRGIDERFRQRYVTEELSIGDYVLSGGEPAAMVVVDVLARLIPGVLNDFESGIEDSFQGSTLDCPWYTRPREFEGLYVPDVLLEGDHKKIRQWREKESLKRTLERRPDLLENSNNQL